MTDICKYGIEVYGEEADGLIRKIAGLGSRRELDGWWQGEIGWDADRHEALRKSRARYGELLERARAGGWETER